METLHTGLRRNRLSKKRSRSPNHWSQFANPLWNQTSSRGVWILKLHLPKEAYMVSRFRIAITLTLLFAFVVVLPVFAGGWAVITLDELPTDVVAGKSLTIGFMVLQHGRTPMTDLKPTVTAKLPKGEQLTFFGAPEG